MRILVAMSGGVDSSVVAGLLHEQGAATGFFYVVTVGGDGEDVNLGAGHAGSMTL